MADTEYYRPYTKEFIQARIDQWEMLKSVAANDVGHANERIEFWQNQTATD